MTSVALILFLTIWSICGVLDFHVYRLRRKSVWPAMTGIRLLLFGPCVWLFVMVAFCGHP